MLGLPELRLGCCLAGCFECVSFVDSCFEVWEFVGEFVLCLFPYCRGRGLGEEVLHLRDLLLEEGNDVSEVGDAQSAGVVHDLRIQGSLEDTRFLRARSVRVGVVAAEVARIRQARCIIWRTVSGLGKVEES